MADLAKLGKIPAYLTNLEEDKSLEVPLSEGMPKLSIRGSKWRIQHGDDEEVLKTLSVRVAIIAARSPFHGALYEGEWDGEKKEPICFTLDKIKPNPGVPQPQSDLCMTCPSNAFGSGKRAGKACPDNKKLIVIPVEQHGDDAADLALWQGEVTPFVLNVPAASLKPYSKYVKTIKAHGLEVRTTVVELSFTGNEYPQLEFEFAGVLTQEAVLEVEKIRGTDRVQKAISTTPIDLSKGDEPEPAPKKTKPKTKKKPAPEPEPETDGFTPDTDPEDAMAGWNKGE